MLKIQDKQLKLNLPPSSQMKVLRLCYFIPLIFLMNCGGNEENKNIESKTNITSNSSDSLTNTTGNNPKTKTILCFGDSITAGYGLSDNNDAFPALLQQKIDSLNLNYTVVNSGLSGETTAGGKSRIDWILNQDIDIFLLELGANDGLRGVDLSETKNNLQNIIDRVQAKSAKITIILAGMELPSNMGQDYTAKFRTLYADLAKANHLAFIPFLLKDVGGVPELNQSDGIHPTEEGHQIIANTVWEVLEPLL